jgi:gas vesicle protein
MASSNREETGNVSAFVIGAVVGAGIALLFAPQAGTQLRRFLRDCAARAKEEFDDALDQGAEAWETAKDRGEELVEKGKESMREAGQQVARAVDSDKRSGQ